MSPRFCSEFGFQSYPSMPVIESFAAPEDRNIAAPVFESHQKNTGGNERIATLRKEMAQTMEDGCGIYRLAETMQATCDKLDELKERFKNVNVEDKSSVWNTEWLLAIELEYQLDVAQSMAYSALNRRESRGAHQRLDGFEKRDDENFLKHSQAHYVAGGAPRIDYGDVKITKSQPGTRAYGAAGEKAEQERKAANV